MEKEIWKIYPKCKHLLVSSLGNFKTTDRIMETKRGNVRYKGKILKPQNCITNRTKTIYLKIRVGRKLNLWVHRAVAETFIPNPENKSQVNHKDGNGLNNKLANLEWVTQSENMQHASKVLLISQKPINGRRRKDISLNLGGNKNLVTKRLQLGWCKDCAISIPINKNKKYIYCKHK